MSDAKSRVIELCRRRTGQGISPSVIEATIQLLRASVRLIPQPSQETGLGRSRIGGLPDMPEGADWPLYSGPPQPDPKWEALKGQPLSFLLQVNLVEVASFDV